MTEVDFTESGKLLKMEVDYSGTVDEKLPVCEKLAAVSGCRDVSEGKLTGCCLVAGGKAGRCIRDPHVAGEADTDWC